MTSAKTPQVTYISPKGPKSIAQPIPIQAGHADKIPIAHSAGGLTKFNDSIIAIGAPQNIQNGKGLTAKSLSDSTSCIELHPLCQTGQLRLPIWIGGHFTVPNEQ